MGGAAAFLLAAALGAPAQDGQEPLRQPSEAHRFRDIPDITPRIAPGPRPVPVPQAPSTLSVLRGDELRDLGVRFFPDALRRVPGLEVIRLSSTETNVSVRGYNDDASSAQGILALVDGRQTYNEFFGSVVWESLPVSLDEIERVEVIRGPGSFVHGPNAMHGLVNIVTKSPLDYGARHLHLSADAGTYESRRARFTAIRREGSTGVKATAGWDDVGQFDPRSGNAKDKRFAEARLDAELDAGHRLGLTAGGYDQKFDVLIPTLSVLPPTFFANEAREGYAKVNWSLGSLRAQATASHFLGDSMPGNALWTPFETTLTTADADVQYGFSPVEGHSLTAGTGYRYASFRLDDESISGGRHRTALEWVFLQDEVAIAPNAWLTAGVRVDHHSVAGTSTSPRLALVWEFEKDQVLRASAGSGFRNPSLRELWFEMPVLGGLGTVIGNRDLRPEQLRSFELGYSGRPGEDWRLEANVFYNLVDRLVEFRAVTPTVFQPHNVNKEETYGGEAEVEYLFADWLSAFVNYAYVVRQDRDTHDRFPAAPRHKANAGARLSLPEGITAMLWVHFFDEVVLPDPTGQQIVGAVDDYALLNARVAYRRALGRAEGCVFLEAFNLLDHDHREHPEGDGYGLLLSGGLELSW
jgi:iron complex outermembrane receptor protein